MTTQINSVEKVSDVIQVMKAGIDFYQEALQTVESESVKNTFRKMITNKRHAVESLQPLAIAEQGEREDGTSIAVESRNLYTKFASVFSSNTDRTYVKQLEEVEDKVLAVLDDALEGTQPISAEVKLREIRVNAQQMHDEMKALQTATKH